MKMKNLFETLNSYSNFYLVNLINKKNFLETLNKIRLQTERRINGLSLKVTFEGKIKYM
jgi:hypothetical protein